MTEVQKSLLSLLEEVDAICRKYNIEYYLAGGCLIGALRNGGFLPWDDDADINISVDNAEKFLKALKAEKLENRVVCTAAKYDKFLYHHWRYINTASTLLARGLIGTHTPQGQFVDFFVNYPMPLDEKKKDKCIESYELFIELNAQNAAIKSDKSLAYMEKYYKAKRWGKIFGDKRVRNYLEKQACRYPEKGAKEYFIGAPFPPKRVTPAEWWGKPRYIKFETTELPIPEYAEKMMCYEYGPTWFEVPSHAERGSHFFVIDLDIPYKTYTREYDKHLHVDQYFADQVRKKELWFSMLQNRNVVNPQIRKLQGVLITMEIQEGVEKYGIDLNELVENGCEKELETIFAPYFAKMNSTPVKYYGVYIDMPDDYLYAALFFQCFNGNYGIAKKILRMRRAFETRPIPAKLQRLYNICDATDAMLEALYGDGDTKKAREITDEWLEKEPNAVYFMRADLFLAIKEQREQTDALLDRCECYLAKYPEDGELLKHKGDLLLRMGNVQAAEQCYQKALCTLHNGYCITAIKSYFETKDAEDGE